MLARALPTPGTRHVLPKARDIAESMPLASSYTRAHSVRLHQVRGRYDANGGGTSYDRLRRQSQSPPRQQRILVRAAGDRVLPSKLGQFSVPEITGESGNDIRSRLRGLNCAAPPSRRPLHHRVHRRDCFCQGLLARSMTTAAAVSSPA